MMCVCLYVELGVVYKCFWNLRPIPLFGARRVQFHQAAVTRNWEWLTAQASNRQPAATFVSYAYVIKTP